MKPTTGPARPQLYPGWPLSGPLGCPGGPAGGPQNHACGHLGGRISTPRYDRYTYLWHIEPGESRERVGSPLRARCVWPMGQLRPAAATPPEHDICTIPAGGRQCFRARTTDLVGTPCSHARVAWLYGRVCTPAMTHAVVTLRWRRCTGTSSGGSRPLEGRRATSFTA